MSTLIDDQAAIKGLRALMKHKKVSVKRMAEGIGIPYRTLQNYLTGQARFPASVFLSSCQFLGLDTHYVLSNSFELAHWDLHDAIMKVFGPVLDWIDVDRDGNITAVRSTPSIDDSHRAITSALLAGRISKEYDHFRKDTLLSTNARRPPQRISDLEK